MRPIIFSVCYCTLLLACGTILACFENKRRIGLSYEIHADPGDVWEAIRDGAGHSFEAFDDPRFTHPLVGDQLLRLPVVARGVATVGEDLQAQVTVYGASGSEPTTVTVWSDNRRKVDAVSHSLRNWLTSAGFSATPKDW